MAGQDRAVKELAEIIASAAPVLRRALWDYWPMAKKDFGIPERFMTVYVSHALMSARIAVYPEVWLNKDDSHRIDFAACDPVRKVMIAAECKALQGDAKAQELAADASRLRSFSPIPQRDCDISKWQILHLLLATTYKPDLADRWKSEPLKVTKEDGPGWQMLCEELRSFQLRRAVTVVSREDDKEDYDLAMLLAIRKADE